MTSVTFINMVDGAKDEYALLQRLAKEHLAGLPDRILDALRQFDDSFGGYQVSRLGHSLQSATRAHSSASHTVSSADALRDERGGTIRHGHTPGRAMPMQN